MEMFELILIKECVQNEIIYNVSRTIDGSRDIYGKYWR